MRLTWWNMKHINPKVSFIIFLLYAKGSRAWSGELCSTSVFRFSATEDLPAARCPSSNVLLLKAPQCETAQPLFHVQIFSEHWSHCSIFYGGSLFNVCCTMFIMYRQQNERQWSDCPEASKSSTHWCLLSHNHITINSIDAKHDNLKMHKED